MKGERPLRPVVKKDAFSKLRLNEVIITSSEGEEVSKEIPGKGGVFTYYISEGLKGEADRDGDGWIEAQELYEYVRKNVEKATMNTQHPMMRGIDVKIVMNISERKKEIGKIIDELYEDDEITDAQLVNLKKMLKDKCKPPKDLKEAIDNYISGKINKEALKMIIKIAANKVLCENVKEESEAKEERYEEKGTAFLKIYPKNDLIKGAKVYIDGKYAGKIEEDVFSKEIPAGKHEILITSEKIEDVKFQFEVDEYGEYEKEIEGKLAKRVVKIITKPTGAKVYVNGKYFGKTPKFVKLEVSKKHLLSLAKYGYETLKTEIYIPSKGDVLNKNYELKKAKIPEIEWQNALGGSDWEEADSIIQTRDGGFVVAGYTGSNNGDVSGNHGETDMWIVKLK